MERKGFEPSKQFLAYMVSNHAPSARLGHLSEIFRSLSLYKAKALFSEHFLCTASHLPILAASDPATTFGVIELNFCVRNGNRCVLYAIDTTPLSYSLKTK